MGDFGTPFPEVNTPDLKAGKKLEDAGTRDSGLWPHIFASAWATASDGLQKLMTALAGIFDEIISLIVPFLTASQGEQTQGFYDLVAALLNDLLGVEVAGSDLSNAADDRGRIGAMQQVGADLFIALGNEFVGNQPDAGPGSGIGGLPGTPGQRLTPEQGVKAAQAFLGFALSFAVRQGNVATLTDALSVHLLGQIREYGEMMAENLGLGRLVRRAMTPFVQTLIATPLQQALNRQYRPHVMSEKQIAAAFIRGEFDYADFSDRLAGLGFTDDDAKILISDTYQRLKLTDILLLEENGFLSNADAENAIRALGFNRGDIPMLRQARQLESVQGADRQYAAIITEELVNGIISQADYQQRFDALRIPHLEKDAITRNAAARLQSRRKHLSLGFLKRAYLDGQVTLDEVLQHMAVMGYDQDDIDIFEVELLLQQAEHKAAAAAKAKKIAAKTGSSGGGQTPPAA